MTATVTPLRAKRSAQPSTQPAYVTIPPATREAFSSLDGTVNELRRTFAASYTTQAACDRARALCSAIEAEARQLRRTL